MATLSIAITDSSIRQDGQFADGTINSLTGYRLWVGRDSGFQFKFTGTDLTASVVSMTTQPVMEVSIDGGAFGDVTHSGASGVRSDDTLASGLSDAEHTVNYRHKSGTQANAGIEIAAAFTATGAAPAFAAPDGYSTARYHASAAPLSSLARYNGLCRSFATNGYNNVLSFQFPDSSIRFNASPTSIKAWILNGTRYRVFQDGTALAAAANATGGGASRYGWDTIASGLDGAEHEYEIVSASHSAALTTANIYELMLIGGDLSATRPDDKYKLLCIGDSMTAGQGTTDSTQAFGRRIAEATNRKVINCGVPSSRVVTFQNFSSALSMGQRMGDLLRHDVCENVDEVLILYGHNDAVNQAALADFYREYRRLVETLMAAYPDANIRCSAILPTTASISPITRADYIAEIADVVTDISDARVTHITMETTDMSPTYNATAGQDTTDGVHPDASGYDKIYDRYVALFSNAPDISAGGGGSGEPGNLHGGIHQ